MKRGTHHYVRLKVIYQMVTIQNVPKPFPGGLPRIYHLGGLTRGRNYSALLSTHPWIRPLLQEVHVEAYQGSGYGTRLMVVRDKMAFLKAAKESGKFHPKQVSDLEQQIVQQVILEAQ